MRDLYACVMPVSLTGATTRSVFRGSKSSIDVEVENAGDKLQDASRLAMQFRSCLALGLGGPDEGKQRRSR